MLALEHGLTFSQFAVLEALYSRGEMSVGMVRKHILSSMGTIPLIINNLVKRNLVKRCSDLNDRRICIVSLTDEGKVPREKIDSFKAGAGTVLYFYDENTVKALQEQFAPYADNFPVWANQANGMLQISVWSALRELEIGASLQHYNPVIDEKVKELFNVPKEYKLIAQMPFGGIVSEPDAKEKEDIDKRVVVVK